MRASDFRRFFQGAALATAVAFAIPSVAAAQDPATGTTQTTNDDLDDDDDTDLGWIGLLGLAGLLGLRRRDNVRHVDHTTADTTRRM